LLIRSFAYLKAIGFIVKIKQYFYGGLKV